MALPDMVQRVVVGADNDPQGGGHARRAAEAFASQGREVRIFSPLPGFKDFNDELRGITS